MRIRVQIPRTLLKSQLQRTVCRSGQLTCHSNVHSSEQETSPLTGWEVKVDTCHCPNLHRQHTEHLCAYVCCVYVRVYAHTCTAYLMCVPTFKKSGWVPLVSLLVFFCLYFISAPLMKVGLQTDGFSLCISGACFVLCSAPLSENPAEFWSVWDILAHHLLVPWVPGHLLFIWATPQEECLNVEAASDMSEAAGSGHLWVVISNLLENSYLFSTSLPISGLFVGRSPTQTPCCIFLLCNICIANYSFYKQSLCYIVVSPNVLGMNALPFKCFKALRLNKVNEPKLFPHNIL